MNLLALAIAPGIAICLFIFHRDVYNREPKLTLLVSFLLGAASILPAIYIEKSFDGVFNNSIPQTAAKAFFVVALTEELGKFLALRYYAYRKKSFDEPLDGIVHAVIVSMGFATVENILYVSQGGYGTAIMRMFLSVPAHATFGVVMGYHVGRAKFNKEKSMQLLALGLFWAVFFHGMFDMFLFWQESPDIPEAVSDGLLFFGALASYIVALRMGWKLIKKHRTLSQQTYAPDLFLNLRAATIYDIPLIQKLVYTIWPATYGDILSKDKMDYMLQKIYSTESLKDQMVNQQHQFIIVNDRKDPVGFASFSNTDGTVWKLHKIYILPSQQGKGTGRFIIDQITRGIIKRNATALQLNVYRQNSAKEFYEKMGFIILKEEDIDIGNGYFMNDYLMEKKLVA